MKAQSRTITRAVVPDGLGVLRTGFAWVVVLVVATAWGLTILLQLVWTLFGLLALFGDSQLHVLANSSPWLYSHSSLITGALLLTEHTRFSRRLPGASVWMRARLGSSYSLGPRRRCGPAPATGWRRGVVVGVAVLLVGSAQVVLP